MRVCRLYSSFWDHMMNCEVQVGCNNSGIPPPPPATTPPATDLKIHLSHCILLYSIPARLGLCVCHFLLCSYTLATVCYQSSCTRPHCRHRSPQPAAKSVQGVCPGTWHRCLLGSCTLGGKGSSGCTVAACHCSASGSHLGQRKDCSDEAQYWRQYTFVGRISNM